MRLAYCPDLHHLGDSSDVRQCSADVINIVVLYEAIKIPSIPPPLARCDRDLYQFSETRKVFAKYLRAHGILDKQRRKAFDQIAPPDRVRQIESLMKIDAEVAILPHAFARLHALPVELIQFLAGVERGIRW